MFTLASRCMCVRPCVVFSGISAFSSSHVVWSDACFHRQEITGAECKTSNGCVYDVDVILQCTTAKLTALYLDAHFREKGADKQQQTWEMLFRMHTFGVSEARWNGMEERRGRELCLTEVLTVANWGYAEKWEGWGDKEIQRWREKLYRVINNANKLNELIMQLDNGMTWGVMGWVGLPDECRMKMSIKRVSWGDRKWSFEESQGNEAGRRFTRNERIGGEMIICSR